MAELGEGLIDTGELRLVTARLGEGLRPYAPAATVADAPLPGRTPGASAERPRRSPVGPRSVLLDCGTSRMRGYTHVMWIAPGAEQTIGSQVFDLLGVIMGRVVGVEAYAWESADRLHVRAPGLHWDDLLREAQEALGEYLAG